ncbi:MAG: hypothetical protein KGN01_06755 [Patescibacteria group bacterium]|nr:hypothetical protein [Patescibacteria group bacterium]
MRLEDDNVVWELATWTNAREGRGRFEEDGIDTLRQIFSRYLRKERREHVREMRRYKSKCGKEKCRGQWKTHQKIVGQKEQLVNTILQAVVSVDFRIKMTPELKKWIEELNKRNLSEEMR